MSSFVYPANIPGLTFDGYRTPEWSTGIKEAVSGKESRLGYRRYPRIKWSLSYELLRDDITPSELKAIVGLFNSMNGQFDTFLYIDPDFNTVTLEPFGTGDGTTTAFQIVAAYQNVGGPGFAERIQNFNGSPSIYKAGVLQTGGGVNYTLGPTGIVTFTSAPAAAAALTWTGSFYYRCRFTSDTLDNLSEFVNRWWALSPIEFKSVPL